MHPCLYTQQAYQWEAASITRLLEPLDEKNWSIWHECIHWVFKVCGVLPYVDGTIQ